MHHLRYHFQETSRAGRFSHLAVGKNGGNPHQMWWLNLKYQRRLPDIRARMDLNTPFLQKRATAHTQMTE